MSPLFDDCDEKLTESLLRAFEEAAKLKEKKPDHDLLRYADCAQDNTVWNEFLARFGPPGLTKGERETYPALAHAYEQYCLALQQVVCVEAKAECSE